MKVLLCRLKGSEGSWEEIDPRKFRFVEPRDEASARAAEHQTLEYAVAEIKSVFRYVKPVAGGVEEVPV